MPIDERNGSASPPPPACPTVGGEPKSQARASWPPSAFETRVSGGTCTSQKRQHCTSPKRQRLQRRSSRLAKLSLVAPPSPEEISSIDAILSKKVIGSYADRVFCEVLSEALMIGSYVDDDYLLLPCKFGQRRCSL